MKKSICAVALLLLLVAAGALIPLHRDEAAVAARSIDPELRMPRNVSAAVARACADCHSQATHWPWYASLPWIGPQIRADVRNGRAALNLSDWAARKREFGPAADYVLMAACADVHNRRMPLSNYLLLHPGARLSEADTQSLCSWAESRIAQASAEAAKFTSFSQHSDQLKTGSQ